MAIGERVPPPLTGGHKMSDTPGDFGFQTSFVGPDAPVEADDRVQQERPSEGVQIGLDWLAITFHPTPVDPIEVDQPWYGDESPTPRPKNEFRDRALLAASVCLSCEPEDWFEKESGFYGYQRSMLGPGGAQLLYDPANKNDGEHFNIFFPGQACELVSEAGMRSYLRFVRIHEGVATRCDVKIDDYEHVISPEGVRELLQTPDVVTHAHRWQSVNEGAVGHKEETGRTIYLGKAGSRQRLRVYDKGLQSDGEINAIRWEMEARKEPAVTLVASLTDGNWAQVITDRLVTFVDFRDHTSAARIVDRIRLPWFARLVGMAQKASAYLPKALRSVDQVIGWIGSQVSTSLAVVFRHWQGDISPLYEIVKEGERKLKPKHLAMLAASG